MQKIGFTKFEGCSLAQVDAQLFGCKFGSVEGFLDAVWGKNYKCMEIEKNSPS